VVRSLQSFMPDGHDNRIRRRGPWAPKVASTRRTLLRLLAALAAVSAVASCGAPPGGDSQVSASSPLGPLSACDGQPYVAMFNGVTQDGLNNEKPGSTPSSDIYGIRPDGSVERFTTDQGTYYFGLSADARTVFAAPYPSVGTPSASQERSVQIFDIDVASKKSTPLSPVSSVADLQPSPDGSQLAIATTMTPAGSTSRVAAIALLHLPAPSDAPDLVALSPAPSYTIRSLAWSPDGRSLAFIATFPDLTTELRVRDIATGEEQTLYGRQGESGALSSLDWSPSGRFLLTVKATVDIAKDTELIQAVEIDVTHRTSFPVLTGVRQALTYTAADDSRISALVNEPGQPVMARTWLRAGDGTFQLGGSTELGKDLGIVGGTHLQLPRCALK
jgi:hypothetical protein